MSVLVLLIILVTGPLGYKYELVPLQPSLVSLLIALVGGALTVLIAVVYLVIAIKRDLSKNRNLILVSIVLGLVPVVVMVPQMLKAGDVPPIHDISTDTANPPIFVAIRPLRVNAPNGVDYGASENWTAEKLASTTIEAYPDLAAISSTLSMGDAVARAEAVLIDMGLEIVSVDEGAGRIEATATTTWFGFKDDMALRIVAENEGSRIDLRSMSRVGQSDVGVNAARILEFVAAF